MQRIEYVFEEYGDAELLAAMGDAQQAERAAFARQLLAVGCFTQRRLEQASDEHAFGASTIGRPSPPRSARN
jgi:hypothetical protein